MKTTFAFLIIGILFIGCKEKSEIKNTKNSKAKFNQTLVDELNAMKEIDQIAAYIREGEYKKLSDEQWKFFKDSVFVSNQKRISKIFKTHGFVGYDLAGKEGSDAFWLIVQHSDHVPKFQLEVLEQMKIHVDKGNATPSCYAYLVDRVKINTGKEQVYGTQFNYNKRGQAFPKNMSDTTGLDQRRISLGLSPMIERMNEMTIDHYLMNESVYKNKGINEPQLYKD